MWYICVAIFAVAVVAQLWACYRYNKLVRAVSKAFLMPALLGIYLSAAHSVDWWIAAALIFSFIGDMLLVKSGRLTLGGVSFFFAHVCYIAAYTDGIRFGDVPVWLAGVSAAGYLALLLVVTRAFFGHIPTARFAACFGYLATVCVMSYFALMQLLCTGGFAWIVYIGTLLFIVSDFVLLAREFRKTLLKFQHKNTVVMATYITAQGFIVCGMLYVRRGG